MDLTGIEIFRYLYYHTDKVNPRDLDSHDPSAYIGKKTLAAGTLVSRVECVYAVDIYASRARQPENAVSARLISVY